MSNEDITQNPIITSGQMSISGPVLTSTGALPPDDSFFATDTLLSMNAGINPQAATAALTDVPLLPTPRISISEFARIVGSKLQDFKKTINQTDADLYIQDKSFWFDISAVATLLVRLNSLTRTQFDDESTEFLKELRQLTTYNQGPLKTYNNELATASTKMLQIYNAQLDVIAHPSHAPAYDALANTWNDNVDQLNSDILAAYTAYVTATNALNDQILADNTKIDQLNAERAALNITTTIPHLPYPVPIAPQPATLQHVPLAPISTTTNPSGFPPVPNVSTSVITTALNPTTSYVSVAEQNFYINLQATVDGINSGSLSALNNEINSTSSHTQALFQATIDLQNGTINAAAYDLIVDDYNAYALGENPTLTTKANTYIAAVLAFNASLTVTNHKIDQFNALRAAANLPPLPPQLPLPVPTLAEILLPTGIPHAPTTVTVQPLIPLILPNALVGSVTPTTQSAYLASYYNNILLVALKGLADYIQTLTLKEAYHDFQMFFLRGISNTKKGFIDHMPTTTITPSAGANAGAATSIVNLSSKTLTSVLSNNLLNNANAQAQLSNFSELVGNLASSTIGALQNASLASAFPALALLGGHADLAASGGVAANTALALSNLDTLSKLISTGVVAASVQDILSATGLSPDDIAKLSGPITAGIELGLLLSGLLQIAKALHLPGLLTQIVGNSEAGQEVILGLAGASGFGFNDVLSNPVSILILKQKLVAEIIREGVLNAQQAKDLVNKAVDKSIADKNAVNSAQFANTLAQNLQDQLDSNSIAKLSDIASDDLRSEQLHSDLDAAFNQKALDQQAQVDDFFQRDDIKKALIDVNNQAANIETQRDLRDAIISSLVKQSEDLASARQAADHVLLSIRSDEAKSRFKSQNINRDQLQTSLINGLVAQGTGRADAERIANTVTNSALAAGLNSELLQREALELALKLQGISTLTAADLAAKAPLLLDTDNPLRGLRASQILDQQSLAEALSVEVKNQLKRSLGIEDATNLANSLVFTILGSAGQAGIVTDQVSRPTSVLNQTNNAISAVKEAYGERANNALAADFRVFTSPSVDLFNFLKRTYDPGQSLLISSAWGIMYREGKIDLKSIDIRI